MKKAYTMIFALTCILFLANTVKASEKPVLLFTDMLSAPNIGWSDSEPNKGAAITVWGRNLGATRGNSFIRVAGEQLSDAADYAIWGESWPTPFWQRITFWLNSSMLTGQTSITVTVNGIESNPLEFTIRNGRIFFVVAEGVNGNGSISSPFLYTQASGGSGFVANMLPGDIYYYREGIYDSKSNGGNSVLWIRDSEPSGTQTHPISLIAFPSESPTFYIATYSVNFNKAFQFSNSYMVFSGFNIDSEWSAGSLANFHRFIGNDLIGIKAKYGSGTGIINTFGSGNIILGNTIHGGNSKDRFDHGSYFSGCADVVGNHLGWNYYYDNDFGRGPIISINHQENRCQPDVQILKAHFVFNNIVDCNPQRAVAINIYDLSYDAGEAEPEPTYVYNNKFLNCGTLDTANTANIGWAPAVIANTAHTRFYNNLIYNAEYVGFQVSANILSVEFRNNIVVMNSSSPLDGRDDLYLINNNPSASTFSNNLFYDMGNSVTNSTGIDLLANIVDSDPLFADPINLNFNLMNNSPAINAGSNDLLFEVSPPSYAPINRDINFIPRTGIYDLGPLENSLSNDFIYTNGFEST